MSKENARILKLILSFIIPIVGFVLFFVEKNKKDAQLFGILGIIGLIVFGGLFIL